MKMQRHWPTAVLAFVLCGLLSLGFLKINPSPFELARESQINAWELILLLACIFTSFAVGVKEAIEQICLWFNQNKLEKERGR